MSFSALKSYIIFNDFFVNQVSTKHSVRLAPKGDFMIDENFIFEVGGASKSFKQIAGMENSYLALDEMTSGINTKIPLWLFGFLY
jgi:hypothetical protein